MAEQFPDFVKKLEETGLLYIRILGEDDDPSSPIGRGWHSTFLTKDKCWIFNELWLLYPL
jgi:hypothetical protein